MLFGGPIRTIGAGTVSPVTAPDRSRSLVDADPRELAPGVVVGPLAFGTWRFVSGSVDDGVALLDRALDLGCTLVDTADVYGFDWGGTGFGAVEDRLGAVLAASPGLRDRMVLVTKGGIQPGIPYDSSPASLLAACDASIRRLGVDHVDGYLVHRPDLFAHPDEVAETLDLLVTSGRTRMVGVSNHTVGQIDALADALDELGTPLLLSQPEFSAAHLDPLRDGSFDQAMRHRISVLAWSPLGGGALASGSAQGELHDVLDLLAEREGVSRAAIAVAFVLCAPVRPVAIVGTQSAGRLEALTAALDVHLDRADCYRIIEASEGVPLP